jgi:hypothetical protein
VRKTGARRAPQHKSSSYSSSSSSGLSARDVVKAQRLEGSRFVSRQLYRFAASGSRERLFASQLYGLCLGSASKKSSLRRDPRWVSDFMRANLIEDEDDDEYEDDSRSGAPPSS